MVTILGFARLYNALFGKLYAPNLSQPTWFVVAQNDEAIPPDAERQFAARMGATTVEVASDHVAMVSHPEEALSLIRAAVAGATVAS